MISRWLQQCRHLQEKKGITVNSKGESVNIRKIYCTGTLLKEKKLKGGNPVSSTALFGHPNIRRTEKTKIIFNICIHPMLPPVEKP